MKTSKKHFKFFCERVNFWIEDFGLKGYEVYFHHVDARKLDDFEDVADSIAFVHMTHNSKCASFYLNKDWDTEKVSPLSLNRAALHEVAHLLLFKLMILAKSRMVSSEDEFDREEHHIIRQLENSILGVGPDGILNRTNCTHS